MVRTGSGTVSCDKVEVGSTKAVKTRREVEEVEVEEVDDVLEEEDDATTTGCFALVAATAALPPAPVSRPPVDDAVVLLRLEVVASARPMFRANGPRPKVEVHSAPPAVSAAATKTTRNLRQDFLQRVDPPPPPSAGGCRRWFLHREVDGHDEGKAEGG